MRYSNKILLIMSKIRRSIFLKRYTLFLIPYTLFLLIPSCDLPHEPGPQPTTIIDTELEPGLNVFGVLRLDDNTGTSFFRIERAYLTEESSEKFSPIVLDAEVMVKGESDTTTYIFSLVEDSIRGDIYANHHFTPEEGERYFLTITAPDLPELTATTIIPVKPSIDLTTMVISNHSISFDLLTTADTNLYDLYLLFPKDTLHQRIVNQNDERISIHFDFSSILEQPDLIEIYGYDDNLSEYLTAPITIKPQIYQETVTTVTGGYGCFGSVARMQVVLE